MARIPLAAKQLVRQATDAKPQTKAERAGEPDGFGTYRSVSFNKATSKWLEPLLTVLSDDRIESTESEDGILTVHFVPGRPSELSHPFDLDSAAVVAEETS